MTDIDPKRVDLANPALWADGPPYELFGRMQREAPVHFSPQEDAPEEGGFWSNTRAEGVKAVSRDFKTLSSERRGSLLLDDIGVPLDVQRMQRISMDPPRHDRLNALVSKAFTPQRVAERQSHIEQIISKVLDGVADRDTFDLVADVARVAGSLLGAPPEDDAKLVHWTNVFTALEDPQASLREGPPRRDINNKADRAEVRARRVALAMVADERA